MNSSLNHVYRIVWNATLGLWQVASEATRGRGKTGSSQQARKARRALAAASALALVSPAAWAVLPTGGVVVAGQASIQQAGNALNIVQGSDKAAIDWQSFSIGQGNTVNFQQLSSSSVALNRVLGNDVSVIQGAINANGQVFLVNQNGVLFTPTAQVNVGGIVASTQNISTDDFMAGRYQFSGNSTATVENQGSIKAADGGVVALIAAKVINTGSIEALKGTVGLAAGNTVLLDLGGPVKIQVTEGALNAAIEQSGGIRADGGTVYLTAKAAGNLAASVINHTGVTKALSMAALTGEAGEVAQATGSIALSADIISQQGTLDASGEAAGTSGGSIKLQAGLIMDGGTTKADGQINGGRVTQQAQEILQISSVKVSAIGVDGIGGLLEFLGGGSGGQAYLSGDLRATGRRKGGQIDATAHSLTLAGATVDTSAAQDAGIIRLGGGWQGKEADLANARSTNVNATTTLTNTGANGTVVVWSDDQTNFGGTLKAAGSRAEISGKENLHAYLANVQAQSLLLDPKNITISDVAAPALSKTLIADPVVAAGGTATSGPNGARFGANFVELDNGNFVVTAIGSFLGGISDSGAVYVLGADGSLKLTLTSNVASSNIGEALAVLKGDNRNKVVTSSGAWGANRGAVTWIDGGDATGNHVKLSDGTTGGVVSSSNSLIGTTPGTTGTTNGDRIGRGGSSNSDIGVIALNNGHIAVQSPNWSFSETAKQSGAITWINGSTGKLNTGEAGGTVSIANSVVGNITNARVGGTLTGGVAPNLIAQLANGNFVVASAGWDNGDSTGANARGAATWFNGNTGKLADGSNGGIVSATNSLIGNAIGARLGFGGNGSGLSITNGTINAGVVAVGNNYVVVSREADLGGTNTGAVSFGDGSIGLVGTLGTDNSMIGTTDHVGFGQGGIKLLSNGNFVIMGGNSTNRLGSATWVSSAGLLNNGSAMNGSILGAGNSLLGSIANDLVGSGGVVELQGANAGKFVVVSNSWGGGTNSRGAVTWFNSDGKLTGGANGGAVSNTNSLIGRIANDNVGSGNVTALSNGHYVVASPLWNNGASDVGSAAWADGSTGRVGALDTTNALIGSLANDRIGIGGVVALSNGAYVVRSPNWDSTTFADVGAVTWRDGTVAGATGVVSSENSLTGSSGLDQAGITSLTVLSNGHYVVASDQWGNNGLTRAGAVTWVNGSNGHISNSTSVGGVISSANSLIGSQLNDRVGIAGNGIVALSNGNYVVRSSNWANGSATTAGAITWQNGAVGGEAGRNGVVSADNSLVGTATGQRVGDATVGIVVQMANGRFAVGSPQWDNGDIANVGAVTFFDAATGHLVGSTSRGGTISAVNSILGGRSNSANGIGAAGTLQLLTKTDRVAVQDFTSNTVTLSNGSVAATIPDAVNTALFATNPGANSVITPGSITALLNAGTAVTLQANNDITVTNAVIANNEAGNGGAFALEAGRHINLNANITTDNANFTAIAGSSNANLVAANTDAGNPTITLANGVSVNAGTGIIALVAQKNATGAVGKLVNNSGSATPFTAALTRIYLPSFADLSGSALTAAAKRYNTLFSATGPTSTTATLTGLTSGVNLFYSLAPTLTVTPTTGQSGTYGGTHTPTGHALSGFVNGDNGETTGAVGGTATFKPLTGTLSSSGNLRAGTYNVEFQSGLSSVLGYQFADAEQVGEYTVNQKVVTVINGIQGAKKGYDGTATATINGTQINSVIDTGGKLDGDIVVGLDGITAQYASKDAGSRVITLTGGTLGGTDGGNYSVVGVNNNNALFGTIGQRLLTLAAAPTLANKVYDGTSTAAVTLNGAITGFIAGETATVTATGTFVTADGFTATKDAGNGIRVSLTPVFNDATGGALASNYQLPTSLGRSAPPFSANITPKELTVNGIAAMGKTYDGNTSATLINQGMVATGVGGESLTVATTGTFNDKNAGARQVNTTSTLGNGTGGLASNYILTNSTNAVDATITQKALTVIGIAAMGKTYDGNTSATLSNQGSVVTGIMGETLTVSTSGMFNDKNAGARKVNTTTTIANNGNTLASNYSLTNANNVVDATIAQKAVSVSGIVADGKTYDGNTMATLSNQGQVATKIDGETLTVSTTGSFDKKDAGARQVNTTTTIANNGSTLASNYTLTNATNEVSATIEQKSLTIAAKATDKVYDGKSTAKASLSTTDVVLNDTVLLNQTAANFINANQENDKNVGQNKTVRVTGLSLSGADAANYKLTNGEESADTKANITTKGLTIAATASNKVYNANTLADVALSTQDMVTGDTLTLNKTAANFDTKNVGVGKAVTVEGLSLGGTDAGNYAISNANAKATDTADISKAALSVGGITADNKTYDASTNAMVSTANAKLNGLFEGDKLVVSATGVFEDKNAGTEKTVNLTSTYTGADVGNYKITDQATTTADIAKLSGVVVTADKQSKTVGSVDPKLTFLVTGLLAEDALTGSLTREVGEAAGLYDITQGTLGNENYVISQFIPAQLTISQPIADVAIANAQTLELNLDLPSERKAMEERSGDVAPFFIAANQARPSGPAQIVVMNGGIKLPAGQEEQQ